MTFNLIQLVGSLIGILTASAGAIFAWIYHFQSLAMLLLGILLGVFLPFVQKNLLSSRTSPPTWLLKGYKYVKTDCLYIIHEDNNHHTYVTENEIEAIKSGVNIFETTYHWTGRGIEEEPTVISPDHTLMGTTVKRNGWRYMYILLGHELRKGARTTIKIRQELHDVDNSFEPFLSKVVSIPMDHITLHVILPESRLPTTIFFREWDAPIPTGRVVREIPGKIKNHSREILWEIQSPVFGYRYSIDWKY